MLSEDPRDIGPNVVVVGVGPWGRSVSREAHRLGKLQAFVDPSQESLSAVRTLLSSPANVRSFTNLDEALAVFPDCAYLVCVPPSQHFRVAHQILKAKCHVWIEKPLCTTLADAEELLCMAKRSDKLIFVDHLMRYNRAHEKLLVLVRSGWLGEIVRVRAIRQNFGTVRIAENALWSLGPHDVSLILGVMDDTLPTNVYCEGQDITTKGIEDYINVHMTFPSGAHAHMEISWMHPKKERRLIVYGRRGYAIVNESRTDMRTPELECAQWTATRKADATGIDLEMQPVAADSIINDLWPEAKDLPPSTPLRSALQNFLSACAGQSQLITDGAEGFRVLRVLVAASNSLKSQAPVQIGDSSSSQPTSTLARKRSVIADGVDGEIVASGRASKRSASRVTATATLSATASTTTTPAAPPSTLPLPTPIAPPVATPVESPQVSAATNAKQDGVPGLKETTTSRGDNENGRKYFVHETAVVDKGAQLGAGVKIWHFVHVMSGARIGDGTSFGQGCYVGSAAVIGKNVRVQNGVSIYDGVTVEDDAFLGPHCVLSNVRTPRAHISRKHQYEKTVIGEGATVGANATIRCGVRLGDYSFVGAGAVVTKDVPAHALVYGNPARIHGWVSTTGCTLLVVAEVGDEYEILQCPDSKEIYYLYARTSGRDSPHLVRKVSK